MKEQSQLERKLDELGRCLKGAPSIVDSVMHRVGQTRIAPCAPMAEKASRGSAGRLLIRLGKLAVAAAAVCMVVVLAWWLLSRSEVMPSAYAQLMEAVENAKKTEWMHGKGTIGGEDLEWWLALRPPRGFGRVGGIIQGQDAHNRRQYAYDPATQTLTISSFEFELEAGTSFSDLMLGQIEQARQNGIEIARTEETIDGTVCIVFTLTRDAQGEQNLRFVVNVRSMRVMRLEGEQNGRRVAVDFDYPATGPRDVYDLGVPRDARVVDLTAPTGAQEPK